MRGEEIIKYIPGGRGGGGGEIKYMGGFMIYMRGGGAYNIHRGRRGGR